MEFRRQGQLINVSMPSSSITLEIASVKEKIAPAPRMHNIPLVQPARTASPWRDRVGLCGGTMPKRSGRRTIGGGRPIVRTMLYTAALHASRRCAVFKAFRDHLEAARKPVKAAIAATARKLLSVLNAMLKNEANYRVRSPA